MMNVSRRSLFGYLIIATALGQPATLLNAVAPPAAVPPAGAVVPADQYFKDVKGVRDQLNGLLRELDMLAAKRMELADEKRVEFTEFAQGIKQALLATNPWLSLFMQTKNPALLANTLTVYRELNKALLAATRSWLNELPAVPDIGMLVMRTAVDHEELKETIQELQGANATLACHVEVIGLPFYKSWWHKAKKFDQKYGIAKKAAIGGAALLAVAIFDYMLREPLSSPLSADTVKATKLVHTAAKPMLYEGKLSVEQFNELIEGLPNSFTDPAENMPSSIRFLGDMAWKITSPILSPLRTYIEGDKDGALNKATGQPIGDRGIGNAPISWLHLKIQNLIDALGFIPLHAIPAMGTMYNGFNYWKWWITDPINAAQMPFDAKAAARFEDAQYIRGAIDVIEPSKNGIAIVGLEEQRRELHKVIEYVLDAQNDITGLSKPEKGILLYGPPGTGKTRLVEWFSDELYRLSGGDVVLVKFKHNTLDKYQMKDVLEVLVDQFPDKRIVIFIDEMDKACLVYQNVMNNLLTGIDGINCEKYENIIFIAASNSLNFTGRGVNHDTNKTILRPGRFGKVLTFEDPLHDTRKEFLLWALQRRWYTPDDIQALDIDRLAHELQGCSFAALEQIMNEALKVAAGDQLCYEHFDRSIERHKLKMLDSIGALTTKERRTVARYLAEEAVARTTLRTQKQVHKVTICQVQTGPENITGKCINGAVFKLSAVEGSGQFVSNEERVREATALLAGNPLRNREKARKLLEEVVFEGINRDNLSREQRGNYLDEVIRLLKQRETEAKELVEQHNAAVDELTEELITLHTLNGHEVRDAVDKHSAA